tara:strand:- start:981 stop:1094 length:114 start_codon:yes stop_codon:yes gene_type:complete
MIYTLIKKLYNFKRLYEAAHENKDKHAKGLLLKGCSF